jgi:hypothetical protein
LCDAHREILGRFRSQLGALLEESHTGKLQYDRVVTHDRLVTLAMR